MEREQTPTTTLQERIWELRQVPSAEEIARRQAVWAELISLQATMQPLNFDPVELLRRAREEDDQRNG